MSLDSWRAGNYAFAVLHVGIGCEHILKALLCSHNPLLISEKGDRAHRFHALGLAGEPGVRPLSEARTIGVVEAHKEASLFMRGRMPVTEQAFRAVADSRNGVAHYAHHDDQAAGDVISVALRVVEAVRAELHITPNVFWGEYEHVFGDLAKVSAMPAQAGQADRPSLERAAEEAAQAERNAARATLSAAVATAVEVAGWGAQTRSTAQQEEAERTALRTGVMTGLRLAGARARHAAAGLLTEYEVLPFPPRPETAQTVLGVEEKAYISMNVKVLITSSVVSGLLDVGADHPSIPVVETLTEIDSSGWLCFPQVEGELLWWHSCPACGYDGSVSGDVSTQECDCDSEGDCPHPRRMLHLGSPEEFACLVCGLALTHGEELKAAGIEPDEV
ncbi:hypothetical protein [Streptomyces sp. NPDC054952]